MRLHKYTELQLGSRSDRTALLLQGQQPTATEFRRVPLLQRLQEVHAALPLAGAKELKGIQTYYKELDIRGTWSHSFQPQQAVEANSCWGTLLRESLCTIAHHWQYCIYAIMEHASLLISIAVPMAAGCLWRYCSWDSQGHLGT